jgi:hypothetical protein
VIDVDAEVMQRSDEASLHAAEQTIAHIEAEFVGDVPNLLDSLVEHGPYAYNLATAEERKADGSVNLAIVSTRDDIQKGYIFIHDRSNVLSYVSLTEIRGEWYTFHEGIAGSSLKATGQENESYGVALFPSGSGKGITGELLGKDLFALADRRAHDRVNARREIIAHHDRYIEAFRSADIEGVLAVLSPEAKAAIRDYVDDTGSLIQLDSREAHRHYYQALFAKYEIVSVDLLRRVTQEWYVFAETRVVARLSGTTLVFNIAEWFMPGLDGLFVARIGHGTDPAPPHLPLHENLPLHPRSLDQQ